MIAYHLDSCQTLKEYSNLDLLKTNADYANPSVSFYDFDTVSNWGKRTYECQTNLNFPSLESLNTLQIELLAETIRQSYFPNMPSRFKSIFAVKELSDFKLWKKYFTVNSESHIFEIEIDASKYAELDASFLKGGIDCNSFAMINSLTKYWSGQKSNSPLPELIIPLPVLIGRRLIPSEIII